MISQWNFTGIFITKGYILWQRTISQIVPVHELFALDRSEKCFFDLLFHYCMEFLNETSQIYLTSKVTYCDKGPSLWPYRFMSYLTLIDPKKCFWPVISLLCDLSELNFYIMFIIKGCILWQRTINLTFPFHELSAFDRLENWFLICNSFTVWNIFMKFHRYV